MSASVIALPTAAPKKVRNRITRKNMAAFEACADFPSQPTAAERRREERMALVTEADLPSLFFMVQALALAMEKPQQRKAYMALLVGGGRTGGREAVAWWESFIVDPVALYREGR